MLVVKKRSWDGQLADTKILNKLRLCIKSMRPLSIAWQRLGSDIVTLYALLLHFAPVLKCIWLSNQQVEFDILLGFSSAKNWTGMMSDTNKSWFSLQWRHNKLYGISNHLRLDCLLNRLFRRRSKKTSKLRVTGLCEGNPSAKGPVTRKMFSFDDVVMCVYVTYIPVSL